MQPTEGGGVWWDSLWRSASSTGTRLGGQAAALTEGVDAVGRHRRKPFGGSVGPFHGHPVDGRRWSKPEMDAPVACTHVAAISLRTPPQRGLAVPDHADAGPDTEAVGCPRTEVDLQPVVQRVLLPR